MNAKQNLSARRWLWWKLTGRCQVRVGDEFVDARGHVHRIVWLHGNRALTDRGLKGRVRSAA